MKKIWALILQGVLISLFYAGTASATIILLDDDRWVVDPVASETPIVPFQDWNASVGQASQQSSVGTQQMSGTGSASAFSDLENSEGFTRFDVTFETTEAIHVTFSGSFDFEDEAFGSLVAWATIQQGRSRVLGGPFFPDAPTPFLFDAVLDPGIYRVFVSLSPNGNGTGFFDFNLDLQEVPEPGTVTLLGTGLLGLGLARQTGWGQKSVR